MTRQECNFSSMAIKLEYSVLVGNVSHIIVLSLNYSGVVGHYKRNYIILSQVSVAATRHFVITIKLLQSQYLRNISNSWRLQTILLIEIYSIWAKNANFGLFLANQEDCRFTSEASLQRLHYVSRS